MPKNINDYLPEKQETELVQAQILKTLKSSAKVYMKIDEITWSDLITAGVKTYLESKKSKKK